MHPIVDLEGGLYLDGESLAAAGFRPGQRVHVTFEDGRFVLGSEPLVRLATPHAPLLDLCAQRQLVVPDGASARRDMMAGVAREDSLTILG